MRQQVIFLHILLCIIGLGTFGPGTLNASAKVTVDASLSHLSFPQDKAARLTLLVTGTSSSADVAIPRVDNVRLQNRGTSSQISVVNGSISSSISHNYLVHALMAGKYTIPPIKVTVAGESYFTKPLTFQVSAAGQQPNGNSRGIEPTAAEITFIRISEKSADHYPGEIVPITIKAYFNQAYRAEIDSLPTIKGDGVVMSSLQDKPQQTEESVNGRMYHVLTWETSLSGIKVGEHPISFFLEASLLIPQKRRSLSPFGNSLFDDPFFGGSLDSFFGGHERKPIVSVSPEIVFNVMPMPTDNQPENFTGAIGDFDLKVSAAPVDAEIGEPMTLTMEISGSGNFDRVEAPVFPVRPEWKVYSPSSNFSEQNKHYSGTKIFEQAVVARTGSVDEIPPLSFSYFDPRQKRYVTITSDPIAINLKKPDTPVAASSPIQSVQPLSPPQQQQADTQAAATPAIVGLAPIHLETGTFHDRIVPLYKSSWWIALSTLCVVLLLGLFVFRLRQRNMEKHPEIEQQKRKKHLLDNDLKRVEQAQAAGNSTSFLALSRTAIQNQLGLLWNIEPAALSLADIKNRLKTESPLIEIFKAAEEAVYGGATLTDEKMQDYFITLKTELGDLL
ncbi:MAG: BatD family protein [Desulforhopalus sp.]